MVERIREASGVDDPRILQAFLDVPRHLFVNPSQLDLAYADRALPLDEAQTISQPSMVAIMLRELDPRPSHHALEIGAGSGYAAALLGRLVGQLEAVEIRPRLAERARSALEHIGITNVRVHVGDGHLGLPEFAPFDRILISAAAESIPTPLAEQLAPGGSLAIPMGSSRGQRLVVATRSDDGQLQIERSVPCVFVPLVHRADD